MGGAKPTGITVQQITQKNNKKVHSKATMSAIIIPLNFQAGYI